jgi:hypothetical protein
MTFEIGFGDSYPTKALFDIEYYQSHFDKTTWNSEISVLPCVEGITKFLESVKNVDFDYNQFIDDAKEIQELRGWLYEKDGNRPCFLEDNDKLHYGPRLTHIRNVITEFADKYGLYVDED